MQIKIRFRSDKNINLPIAHRHAVQSMIYNVLTLCPEYSKALHDKGITGHENISFKLFTFSPFKGNYTRFDKRIIFENEIDFEVRCHDPFMCRLLLEGFSCGSEFQLLHNKLTVISCKAENRIIENNTVIVKMVSPVTVLANTSDKHTAYFSPEEHIFYERLVANAFRKWCTLFNEDDFDLKISPADGKFSKLVTLFKGTYVNAWNGRFVLEGKSEVLSFLYNVGLGNKSSQGFGMFEICEKSN